MFKDQSSRFVEKKPIEETISFVYFNNKQYLFAGKYMVVENSSIYELISRRLTIVLKTSVKVDETLEKLLSFFSFRLNISARAFFKNARKYTKVIKQC
uniref:HTH LytTR-type domain-containing protein n=1 Tax=Strongyloides stercoralis TaxID=6248 RepID=A0A0K0E4Y6_STRER